MATWAGWETDVLRGLGAPVNVATTGFLTEWQTYEQSNCSNNPLNTTQPEIGASNCNSVGVKSYPSPAVGTAATVTTLENGYYPDIVAALRSGDPYTYSDPQAVAQQITKWGTPNYAAAYLLRAGAPAGAPGAASGDPPPVGGLANSGAGWHQINLTLARTLPHALIRSQKLGRATARNLAPRHK